MKKFRAILLFVLILIATSIVFAGLIKDRIPNNIFSFLDIGTYQAPPKSFEVNASSRLGQSFISNFDNLFMMSIFVPKQNLNRDDELYFHLKRNKNDKADLVTLNWKYRQIHFKENNFYIIPPDRESTEKGFHFHFQFPVIADSKNKEFYFYFDSPTAKVGDGIKVGVWDNVDYYEALTKGQMFINHKPVNGFLAFRTFNTWQGNSAILIGEIKRRLSKDRPFLAFYGASLLAVFAMTIAVSLRPKI